MTAFDDLAARAKGLGRPGAGRAMSGFDTTPRPEFLTYTAAWSSLDKDAAS